MIFAANEIFNTSTKLYASLQEKFYFTCIERSTYHKIYLKRTKCQYFDHPSCALETVPDGFGGLLRTRDSF